MPPIATISSTANQTFFFFFVFFFVFSCSVLRCPANADLCAKEPDDAIPNIADASDPCDDSQNEYTFFNMTYFDFMTEERGLGKRNQQFDTFPDDYDIFSKLMVESGLIDDIELLFAEQDDNVNLTLFLPRDLAIRQTIYQIRSFIESVNRSTSTQNSDSDDELDLPSEAEAYATIIQLTQLYENPRNVLTLLMRNHVVKFTLYVCLFSSSWGWVTLANFYQRRSGLTICNDNIDSEEFTPAKIFFRAEDQFVRTREGLLFELDLFMIPDLSDAPLSKQVLQNQQSNSGDSGDGSQPPPLFSPLSASPSLSPAEQQQASQQASPTVGTGDTGGSASGRTPLPSGGGNLTLLPSASNAAPNNSNGTDADGNSQTNNDDLDGAVCFPSSARVLTTTGWTRMDSLRIGDYVVTDSKTTAKSEVFMFSHRVHTPAKLPFVRIRTRSFGLSISASHLMYKVPARTLVQARDVHVGDVIYTVNGLQSVTHVSTVWMHGLYAPHSMAGELVVDGVAVSCYTNAVHYATAHSLMSPLRAAVRSRILRSTLNQWLASVLAHGAPLWARSVLQQ